MTIPPSPSSPSTKEPDTIASNPKISNVEITPVSDQEGAGTPQDKNGSLASLEKSLNSPDSHPVAAPDTALDVIEDTPHDQHMDLSSKADTNRDTSQVDSITQVDINSQVDATTQVDNTSHLDALKVESGLQIDVDCKGENTIPDIQRNQDNIDVKEEDIIKRDFTVTRNSKEILRSQTIVPKKESPKSENMGGENVKEKVEKVTFDAENCSVADSEQHLEKVGSRPELKENKNRSNRSSKEEKRFHVGSISTERQFPNSSRISLLKIFDSPSVSTPKVEESTVLNSSITQTPKHSDHSKRLTFGRRDKEVLIGTPVKEGHANYMLMYDMLTGIRVSVSRCTAKLPRPLNEKDFSAAHKLAFDITGTEMTPSSKYDFKFKDYAPWAFRDIRDIFHVDPAEYLLSLTGKYVLSELGSPGKSGSFFYFSQDYRFIIKTIHRSEHKFLRRILKHYHEHVKLNPHTLISRIFGLHRVKLPGNRKIHFVVMGNIFPPNKDIHEVYDLKGSSVGRLFPEEKAANNPKAVLKDKNWINRGKKLNLGPEKRMLLIKQMERDVQFLVSQKIMDYSLLIGIHDIVKGNSSNIRDNTLAIFEPKEVAANSTLSKAALLKEALAESDLVQLGPSSARLPEMPPPERTYCYFYQDFGGFAATNEMNLPEKEIYYIGIIDILTYYDTNKKMEHFFRSLGNDPTKISAVNPNLYGSRFLNFMKNAIRGFNPT